MRRPLALALAAALTACAGRTPAPAERVTVATPPVAPSPPTGMIAEAPAPAWTPPPPLVRPADPPCPATGWATPAGLVGPWSVHYGWVRGGRESGRTAERHDYLADGTVLAVHIVRLPPPRAELEAMTGGQWIGVLPRPEARDDAVGTWSVDPSGVRELRLRSGAVTRVSRERVWIAVGPGERPTPVLHVRTLARGADGAWRGEVFFEERRPGATRGYESRIELRFDPPLAPERTGPVAIEVRRSLRVWGGGKPATWTRRARDTGVVEDDRVVFADLASAAPGDDERLWEAFNAFDVRDLARAAEDALIARRPSNSGPLWLGRNTDPPILWHDMVDHGRCAAPGG